MGHRDEAHEPAGRTPQQVAYPILYDHLALAVDGTFSVFAALGILQQGFQLDLAVIDLGPASLARAALLVRGVGDGVGLHPGDQVIVVFEQAGDDLARGIVGVGDEIAGLRDGDDAEEDEHLVEQGAGVAVGPHDTLVDAHGERHGEHAGGGVHQQADGLHRVSHDVFGLGV